MSSCRWFLLCPWRSPCSLSHSCFPLIVPSALSCSDRPVSGWALSSQTHGCSSATTVKCLVRTQANLDNLTVKWNKGQRNREVSAGPSLPRDGEEPFPHPT